MKTIVKSTLLAAFFGLAIASCKPKEEQPAAEAPAVEEAAPVVEAPADSTAAVTEEAPAETPAQ